MTAEIAALDINQERTHAILAGREILETVRISGTTCSEDLNIREALYKHDRYNATRNRDNLDIHDVKWSNGNFNNYIACAATNGKVVVYDLTQPGFEAWRLHEHHRQVHRVAFSPFQGALLLSASHDSTVRLWDLRIPPGVAAITSKAKFLGQSEGIRDVRWSPTDILEFALGTDSGSVQRWDHRNPKAAKLKINAHEVGCTSIDWHPDGKHLLSAGQDRTSGSRSYGVLKIWDFSSDHKRQKPAAQLRTPYTVSNARWRPPCWSGDELGRGSWQATQVMTSYDEKHPVMHLWDFRRPYIPFREMYASRTAPTDMLWHSIDLLWSVGREGEFHQTDVKYAPKTIDRRPLSTFAISPTGEMVAFGQKRSRRRYSDLELSLQGAAKSSAALRVMPKSGMPELSRSSMDDSIDDTFLSSSYQPKHHERSLSNRSTKSLASTPPSLDKESLLKFDVVLEQVKDSSLPQQTALRGPLPGTGNVNAFSYLAQKYKSQAIPEDPVFDDYKNVAKAFEQNANYASRTGHHRASQAWKDVGALLQQEVTTNGEHNRRVRISKDAEIADPFLELPEIAIPSPQEPLEPAGTNGSLKAALSDGHTTETDSNMPTPLARPHTSTIDAHAPSAPRGIPEPPHDDQLSLPPSVVSGGSSGFPKSSNSGNSGPAQGRTRRRPTIDEAPTWFSTNDINEKKAQMTNWRPQPKAQVNFDTPVRSPATGAVPIPPPTIRHNSDESFAMFPSSSESRTGLTLSQSISSLRDRKPSMSSIPEDLRREELESYPTINSGSTSFSIPNEENSASGSSRGDVFNGSFDSMQLSESPLGTRALSPSPFPTQKHKEHTPSKQAPKRSGIPRPDHLTRSKTAAPAVQPLSANSSKELLVEDFQRPPGLTLDRSYPITAGKMLQQSITYHTALVPDPQQIFHLTSLLKPFLPSSSALATYEREQEGKECIAETRRLLEEYVQYCKNDLGLDSDEIALVLTDHLTHLARFMIHPLQMEAIFMAYQEQLERGMLYTPSTILRNLLYPSYGAFREYLLDNSSIGLVCLKCSKPVNPATGKCEKCNKKHDPCPICWQKYSPYTMTKRAKKAADATTPTITISASGRLNLTANLQPPSSISPKRPSSSRSDDAIILAPSPPVLYQHCLTCGHSAHAACLQIQQKSVPELGGRCPTAGCGCPCIPGFHRDQVIKQAEEEKAKKNVGKVTKDGRRVGESGAVRGVRGLLGGDNGAAGSGGSREGVDGKGVSSGEGERGKRVRIVEGHSNSR